MPDEINPAFGRVQFAGEQDGEAKATRRIRHTPRKPDAAASDVIRMRKSAKVPVAENQPGRPVIM